MRKLPANRYSPHLRQGAPLLDSTREARVRLVFSAEPDARAIRAVGWSGTIVHSSDGDHWEEVSISATGDYSLRAITWSGTRFVAAGSNGTIVTSP